MVWAARPATIPTTPAEASRLAPTARTDSNVMSIAAKAATTVSDTTKRRITITCVRTRRTRSLLGTSTS